MSKKSRDYGINKFSVLIIESNVDIFTYVEVLANMESTFVSILILAATIS